MLLGRISELAGQAGSPAAGWEQAKKNPQASGYTGELMPIACSPKPGLRALWGWPGLSPAATAQSLCRAKETKQSLILDRDTGVSSLSPAATGSNPGR